MGPQNDLLSFSTILSQADMFIPSSDNLSNAACSFFGALRLHLQPLFDCFGPQAPQRDSKEEIRDTPYSPAYSLTGYLRSTYVARVFRRLLDLFRAPVSLPSNSRDISPLTLDGRSEYPRDHSTTYSLVHGFLQPLLVFSTRRPQTPLCGRCPNETGCLLADDHALVPCPCPNDHRVEHVPQTTETAYAFHSLYCIKCGRYCYVCVGPSDV